jgi:hypothetical protein
MLDEQRVMWLIGGGGSGLPLPLAFSTVIETVIDNDYASMGQLVKALSDALGFKEDRVLASPFRTWEGFTEGIVGQLESVGVLQNLGGRYFINPEGFQSGVRITAIPNTSVWFIAREKEDRERVDRAERMLMDVRAVLQEFKRFARYPEGDLGKVQQAERLLAEQERALVAARAVTGTTGLPEQRTRADGRVVHVDRPSARELAAQKYGLGGGVPVGSTTVPFGPDGKRLCSRCRQGRIPEDYDVYTDGKGKGWFLRGVCRGCLAQNRVARKTEKRKRDADRYKEQGSRLGR